MAQIRKIRKRRVAVQSIQRITKTMQMIATAKFTSAVARAKASQPYTEKIRRLVAEVASAAGDVENPLLYPPTKSPGRELLVVISSDRGFCGAYNGNVLRTGLEHVRTIKSAGREITLETSGKKAIGFFRFQRVPVAKRHTIGDKPKYVDVERLASRFMEEFVAGKYDAVRVCYMRYISNSKQVSEIMQLLPLKPPAETTTESSGAEATYEFSPSADELLADLLPLSVKTALFQAFNESVVSEQIMRMVAMKAATENAKDVGKTLRRQFNRARQAKITTELTEIVGGAAALE